MFKLFDRDFFRFAAGFVGIIGLSFVVLLLAHSF